MDELKGRIDELAQLMDEFSLSEARMQGPGWRVSFRRHVRAAATNSADEPVTEPFLPVQMRPEAPAAVSGPPGIPVTSPMNGIFYSSPSPSAPPFVRVGEEVASGQVVGLIEAMKVFNEIVAPVSGTVERVVADSGQLVQPGDPLLYIS